MQAGVKISGPNIVRLRTILKQMERPPVRRTLHQMGLFLAARIQQNIRLGRIGHSRIRANMQSTIDKKGSRKPLIDTGHMLAEIQTWPGDTLNSQRVGIPTGITHSDTRRTVAQVGHLNEAGTVLTEARSFLLPTVLLEAGRLMEIMAKTVGVHMGLSVSEYARAVRRNFRDIR